MHTEDGYGEIQSQEGDVEIRNTNIRLQSWTGWQLYRIQYILLLSAALGGWMAGKSFTIQPLDAAVSPRKFYQIQSPWKQYII
jgi:hypothetical protein